MTTPPIRVLELRSVRGTGGGPEKTILAGAARADRARLAVTVCYLRDRRDQVFAVDEAARAAGVDYVDVLERHSFDPRIWPALVRIVKERLIDIIHAHDYKTDLLALALHKATGAIPLATAHGWTGATWRERAVYYPVDRRVLARYPRVIAVSTAIAGELVRCGVRHDRVVLALNGIDAAAWTREAALEDGARARFGIPGNARVICSAGRLEPQKRFDRLVAAVAALRTEWPTLHLLIAGDGSLRASLETLMRDRLGDGWTLPGHLDDLRVVHHASDLFVQSSSYEGTSNALLEAMAMRTPVVATDVGGTRDLLRDEVHGLLVPADSAPALQAAIAGVLRDPAAARQRAAQARRLVEGPLAFDRRVRQIEAIYEELMESQGGTVAGRDAISPW